MPLAGKGMLITSMDVDAADEPEFNIWYDREHLSERVAIEGEPVVVPVQPTYSQRTGMKRDESGRTSSSSRERVCVPPRYLVRPASRRSAAPVGPQLRAPGSAP